MDLHLHCKKWDKALGSGLWEPEEIVEKLPEFLMFIKKVQGLIKSDQAVNHKQWKIGPKYCSQNLEGMVTISLQNVDTATEFK